VRTTGGTFSMVCKAFARKGLCELRLRQSTLFLV
jgi:hypothetical protein